MGIRWASIGIRIVYNLDDVWLCDATIYDIDDLHVYGSYMFEVLLP
jgi:hypothetical protein